SLRSRCLCGASAECFFFSSRRRHTRLVSDWSSDVCSSDLMRRRLAPTTYRVSSQERWASLVRVWPSLLLIVLVLILLYTGIATRSEERRVGKECSAGGWADD